MSAASSWLRVVPSYGNSHPPSKGVGATNRCNIRIACVRLGGPNVRDDRIPVAILGPDGHRCQEAGDGKYARWFLPGQVDYFDKGFPGLALRVSYGGGKSWVFFYRIAGKLRRMTLGTFPAL